MPDNKRMPDNNSQQSFLPGTRPGTVIDRSGNEIPIPEGWELLKPGDPGLTRRVKAAGSFWKVEEKKGRRLFSKGIYAPQATIAKCRDQLAVERDSDTYKRKRIADQKRRESKQVEYVDSFESAVITFLNFHESHNDLAVRFAKAVTEHATPVGSGTVARTQRIPIEQRASAAVIAWMRHQTTAYDSMSIPRQKGARREVRRMLAARSQQLLASYRNGSKLLSTCPLAVALRQYESSIKSQSASTDAH